MACISQKVDLQKNENPQKVLPKTQTKCAGKSAGSLCARTNPTTTGCNLCARTKAWSDAARTGLEEDTNPARTKIVKNSQEKSRLNRALIAP